MPRRITEDHDHFRDVISGRTRKELKRLSKGRFISKRAGKNGKMTISIPSIDIPHFVTGTNGQGVGRGKGKRGDVIGRDPQPGEGDPKAGDEHQDGVTVSVDLEDVLKFLQNELELPDMQPKPTQTFEDVKIVYNDISRTGPDSLRHTRRTLLETLRRMAMTRSLDKKYLLPGSSRPMRLLKPINSDRRYRQYSEIKIPSSNAVIFFARDCSGSMDDFRCDIVSDLAWWIDVWIKRFYERVERCYIVHDTEAQEVSEEKFYRYRQGGGTMCSSAFKEIAHQMENKYKPETYNIYVFYFTDGDNWANDSGILLKTITENFKPEDINLIGLTQVCPWNNYADTVKAVIDQAIGEGKFKSDWFRTTSIGDSGSQGRLGSSPAGDDLDEQKLRVIKTLLGQKKERV